MIKSEGWLAGATRRGFRHRAGQVAVVALGLWLAAGCAQQVIGVGDVEERTGLTSIFVVNYGWHSGIAINASDIAERALPEIRDFPGADFIELGWGDWDYYQAIEPGYGLLLKAALWPTRSVLYVAGIKGPLEHVGYDDMIELLVDDQALRRMLAFVSGSFLRESSRVAVQLQPGHYYPDSDSAFYPARGRFHLLRNCNTWVAEALAVGGLPINTRLVFTSKALMNRVRPFAGGVREKAQENLNSGPGDISIRDSVGR